MSNNGSSIASSSKITLDDTVISSNSTDSEALKLQVVEEAEDEAGFDTEEGDKLVEAVELTRSRNHEYLKKEWVRLSTLTLVTLKLFLSIFLQIQVKLVLTAPTKLKLVNGILTKTFGWHSRSLPSSVLEFLPTALVSIDLVKNSQLPYLAVVLFIALDSSPELLQACRGLLAPDVDLLAFKIHYNQFDDTVSMASHPGVGIYILSPDQISGYLGVSGQCTVRKYGHDSKDANATVKLKVEEIGLPVSLWYQIVVLVMSEKAPTQINYTTEMLYNTLTNSTNAKTGGLNIELFDSPHYEVIVTKSEMRRIYKTVADEASPIMMVDGKEIRKAKTIPGLIKPLRSVSAAPVQAFWESIKEKSKAPVAIQTLAGFFFHKYGHVNFLQELYESDPIPREAFSSNIVPSKFTTTTKTFKDSKKQKQERKRKAEEEAALVKSGDRRPPHTRAKGEVQAQNETTLHSNSILPDEDSTSSILNSFQNVRGGGSIRGSGRGAKRGGGRGGGIIKRGAGGGRGRGGGQA